MDEIGMGEIYLEPEEEKIKNAAEIAAVSESMEKFIFTVFYTLSDKEVILLELKRIGAVIVNHTDKDCAVTVKMSMEQLAAIKTLECVERVEMPEQNKAKTISMKDGMEATSMVVSQVSNENEISLLCYGDGGSSGSDCDCSNDISTAIYLPLSTWKSGSIHCPYAETWYRFTASVSNASQYRIYTTGSLDTMGYLYDANGSYIIQNDDNGGLNFSITGSLTYGATYYICVRAYGSNTGNFSLRVDYTTSSSSGNDNSDDGSNDMSTAITLPLSTYVGGSIECPCAEKWYRFTASNSNASQYTIYTSGSLDTVGYLYNSNGTLITSNDDSGANMNFSITSTLTYGATYYLKVKAYSSNTGSYNVRVDYQTSSAEPDDNDCSNEMSSAINLSLNSWQGGEICCPGAEIWYKFTPSTTAYYTIYTVGSLDTYGYLYDANGTEIDRDDDDGSSLNFKMVQRLTANQTYYIKAKAYGSNTGNFSIAVTSTVFVETVSINKSYIALDKGKTEDLDATVTPSYATNKTLRWETGDASVATVNQDGVVTARGAGTTCICAYSQDGSNKSSCCEVSVNVPVESVTINPSSLLMRVGEYDYLCAVVCPTDAVNKLIRWSSSDTSVVWVEEAIGRVEARGVGSATVYATAQDGTGVKGSCAIQVEPPIPVQGIDICCETVTMNVGKIAYLSYDIYPSDATNKGVTWCSSNPNVAEVDTSTGKITAKSIGSTLITVSTNDGCFTATAFVGVEKTKIYQTENTFRYKGDGTLAEDLEYNDISVSDLKAMDWINWSDFVATDAESFRDSWEYMCTSLFSTEPLQTVVLDMIDHFMSGTGTDYSNETLTEKVIAHSSTQTYIESVKNCINQLINLYNGDIMQLYYIVSNRNNNPLVQLMKNNKIYQPVYNTTNDKITGLTICLDGLWGNQIEVKSFSKSGNSYSGVLSFTLYDHFGLDAPDVEKYGYLAGFRAWYILQHNKDFNGTYKPFVTKINFDIPFSGSIS